MTRWTAGRAAFGFTSTRAGVTLALGVLAGCGSDAGESNGESSGANTNSEPDTAPAMDAAATDATRPDLSPPDSALDRPDAAPPPTASVSNDFGIWSLDPYQESNLCIAWTLENEAPLYLQSFRMRNGGAVHHANWYVVPDSLYDGPDGFFNCEARAFNEVAGVITGTAIYAQSTQAQYEVQDLGPGVAIKLPARHRIIAAVHLLNLSSRRARTFVQATLDLLHPQDVQTVAAPFRLFYNDLHIPPQRTSRFETECDFGAAAAPTQGDDFQLRLFYALPHYHQLGSGFSLSLLGGPSDGVPFYEVAGFDADANGRRLDPPVVLDVREGARGFRFSCDYRNPTSREIGYGYGDGEMCMMLGFADSPLLFNAGVAEGDAVAETIDGIEIHRAPCRVTPVPRKVTQDLPSAEELAAPLYVPEGGNLAHPVEAPNCMDSPADALPDSDATLTRVRDDIFRPSCSFSACHGGEAPAAGLLLEGDVATLRRALLRHEPQADTVLDLIVPGDPLGSWLYQLVSLCSPQDDTGRIVRHMPLNAPQLLEPELVGLLRSWIMLGAEAD